MMEVGVMADGMVYVVMKYAVGSGGCVENTKGPVFTERYFGIMMFWQNGVCPKEDLVPTKSVAPFYGDTVLSFPVSDPSTICPLSIWEPKVNLTERL